MIDREKRDHLAHRLRLLAAGQITNDEFEDSLNLESKDTGIWRIFNDGAWTLYSDLHEYKLVGRDRLTKEVKRNVSRVILFLKSDREFEWKNSPWYVELLIGLLGIPTFGLIPRIFYKSTWAKQGDVSVWPYIRKSDFDEDLSKRPFLCGSSSSISGVWCIRYIDSVAFFSH